MKVVVIEDEKNAREVLIGMLNLIDSKLDVVGYSDNVGEAVELIHQKKPEILFLDIHIKNGNGFDVLNNLYDFNGKVVFTTAHADYAVKAFQYSALDYLLKPISPLQLKHVVEKAKNELNKEKTYRELIENFKHNFKIEEPPKIVLKTLKKQYVISVDDIIRCKSEGAYTKFYLKDSEVLTSKNLKYYDSILNKYSFIRTHQSHLVNTKFIKTMNSNGFLELFSGDLIPVSARKKSYVNRVISEQ